MEATFQKVLAAAQKRFDILVLGGSNPAPLLERAAREQVELLTDAEVWLVLSTRPQAFARKIGQDTYVGRDTLRDLAIAALVEQVAACIDVSGLDPAEIRKWQHDWQYGTLACVRDRLDRFLAAHPMVCVVTAKGVPEVLPAE